MLIADDACLQVIAKARWASKGKPIPVLFRTYILVVLSIGGRLASETLLILGSLIMHFPSLLGFISLSTLTLSSPTGHSSASISYFNNNTIFQSPPDYTTPGTLYARTIQLHDGSLLSTWENYSPEPPPVYFPIYRSTDYGVTWTHLSNVTDQSYGWGNRYQPFLYLLPHPFAEWPAGTIFLSGSSIPTDLSSTHIELYASSDNGVTWEFVSHIAAGGEAVPDNGLTPVWEPYLLLVGEKLICYYSDQRDNATHGQKLVHQTTTDGYNWGAIVDDVAYANYTSRPGMPIVAKMGKGPYVMTYEYGGGPVDGVLPVNYTFPVFYKVSADPEAFGQVEGMPIVTNDAERTVPASSPYVIWDKEVGLIVSCGTLSEVFVNKGTDVNGWESRITGEGVSYTRSLRMIYDKKGGKGLSLSGGGLLPPSEGNKVTIGVVDVEGW